MVYNTLILPHIDYCNVVEKMEIVGYLLCYKGYKTGGGAL